MIRLSADKPTEIDVEKIVRWLNDKTLMKYSEQRHIKHTIVSQNRYIESMDKSDNLYLTAYVNGALIGTVSAEIDNNNAVANVGILIGSEHTGKGHGCAVWRKFCEELAARMEIRKIEAGCMARNTAMIRIFEKNSMRLEGTRRYHFQTGKNQYDDMVLYGMLT